MSYLTPIIGDTSVGINVTLTDGSTGQTVKLVIRRISDGFNLDFFDNTFKASGHTTREQTMTEVSATDSPGTYEFKWDSSSPVPDLTNADYLAEMNATVSGTLFKTQDYITFQSATVTLATATQASIDAIETDTNEIQGKLPTDNIMGSAVLTSKDDEIDAIKAKTDNLPGDPASESNVSAVGAAVVIVDATVDAIKLSTDNLPSDPASETNVDANETKIDLLQTDSTKILGLSQENYFLDQTVYSSSGLLTSGRIRIFPDNTFTATDGGSGEGEIETYNIITAIEAGRPDLAKTYQVKKV